MISKSIFNHLNFIEGNFEDPVIINNLNDYYYRALLYEFDLNHRTPFFITRWKEVMGDLPRLNELQAKSIGKLTPVSKYTFDKIKLLLSFSSTPINVSNRINIGSYCFENLDNLLKIMFNNCLFFKSIVIND